MLKEFQKDRELYRDWGRGELNEDDPRRNLVTPEIKRRGHLGVYDSHLDEKYFPAIEKAHKMLGYMSDFPEKEVPINVRTYGWFESINDVLKAYSWLDALPYRKIVQSCHGRSFMPNLMIEKEVLKWKEGQPLNMPPLTFEYYLSEEISELLPK